MKRVLLWPSAALIIFAFAVLGIFGWWRITYDRQFDAMREAIAHRADLTVIKHWRHEDIVLEDFGFLVRSTATDFWIDIVDATSVRMPDDEIAGLLIRFEGDKGSRAVSIYSPYWKEHGLPKVKTTRAFLENAQMVVSALIKSPPPTTNLDSGPYAEHSMYLRIRIEARNSEPRQ